MDMKSALGWGRDELGAERGSLLWRDAEILLAAASGRKRYEIFLDGRERIPEEVFEKYAAFIFRRRESVPVAYIAGSAEFMSLPFLSDTRALIPRPETEILLELALGVLNNDSRVMDVGTGSGNIAVSAAFYTGCQVFASDISVSALDLARQNAAINGVLDRVDFLEGDIFEPFRNCGLNGFDLLVSNPPYVKTGDIKYLQEEISMYEPRIALDGGKDGLDFYRRIADGAPAFLDEGGSVLVETGYDQGAEAADILRERGFSVRLFKDYSGICRVVEGKIDG